MAQTTHSLTLARTIDAPPALLYRCWTEPDLLKQWFTPRPWTTPVVEIDLRPGGSNVILMRGPNGEEHQNRGVYLEVVPGRRLVMTDAYTEAWVPSAKPYVTIVVEFADAGEGRTAYHAEVLHWTAEDRKAHEDMGFHAGWGAATDQLEALVKSLMSKGEEQ
jgi:uncharacterized protein YndB with AHSA1/START domain